MSLRSVLFAMMALVVAVPGACYAVSDDVPETGVHQMYESAKSLFDKKKYKEAVAIINRIEALYPFSQVAIDGSLMAAVANYELKNYREAATIAEGYIGVYPNSEVVDYAYYIRLISKYMVIPDLGLDSTEAREMMDYAVEFTKMFPKSKYLGEVQGKLAAVREHIAAKEFSIGKFYLDRGEYIAAIKRFSALIDEYHDSRYCNESIYRLVEAYAAIGDRETASKYLSILESKGGAWYSRGVQYLKRSESSAETPVKTAKVKRRKSRAP